MRKSIITLSVMLVLFAVGVVGTASTFRIDPPITASTFRIDPPITA